MNKRQGSIWVWGAMVLGLLVLAPVIKLVLLPWFKFVTKVDTNQQLIERTYDVENVVYNYEWFKNRFEAIGAIDLKVENAKEAKESFETLVGPREDWTFEDKNEASRLNTIVLGLRNQREDLIAEYNARAKMANRNIFQDRLPLFINLR